MKNKSLSLVIFGILILALAKPAVANWRIDPEGNVLYRITGQVLGDTDLAQGNSAAARSNTATQIETSQEENTSNRGQERALEVRTQNELKTSLGTSKRTVNVKPRGNQIELSADNDSEIESQLEFNGDESTPSGEIVVDDHVNKNRVKIRAHENAAVVIRNNVAAKTNFPLMVNLETNELMVTTPKGTKIVTILPDAAVQNMLAANVLDQLGGKGGLRWLEYQDSLTTKDASPSGDLDEGEDATPSGDLDEGEEGTPSGDIDQPEATDSAATPSPTPAPELVEEINDVVELIETEDGRLAYRIDGMKAKKLLGLFDIQLERQVIVSAETGELLQVVQDFRTRLLDILSVNTV